MKIEKIIVEREDGKKMTIRRTDNKKEYPISMLSAMAYSNLKLNGMAFGSVPETVSKENADSMYIWTPAVPDGKGGFVPAERTDENLKVAAEEGIIFAISKEICPDTDEIYKAQEADIRNISLWLKGEMFGYDIEGENGIEDTFEGFTDIVSATEYLIGWFETEY